MKRTLIICILCAIAVTAAAQQEHSWERIFEEIVMTDDENSTMKEEAFDILCELEQHPLNLNTATREDLERIPFLTAQQIEEIQAYVYQYRGMKTLGELMMIESLDANRRKLLCYFVYVASEETEHFPSPGNILKYGKHSIMFTAKLPFYERKGDQNGYLGYKYQHSLRYKFHYGDYLQVGLVGAQDAGEPFFANRNPLGYDHYSFYALVRKLGSIKTLAVGCYKVRIGEGLVINNDFNLGKTAMFSTFGRRSSTIRAHSSRSQANYLQGAAATIQLSKRIDMTAFASYRRIDATLNDDGNIQTILETGYHRTEREMEKKRNASQTMAGANLQWADNGFHIGLTGLYTRFDKSLQPNTSQQYRLYYPQGNDFWNVSVNYGFINHRWNFSGETATRGSGSIAMLNSLSFQATEMLSLMAIQRFYGHRYYSLHAASFSEGGRTQNENGLLLGANWKVNSCLSLTAYTDYAYFAKPRYQASIASDAWDNLIAAVYNRGNYTLSARYRLKIRTRDNVEKTQLVGETTQRARFAFAYSEVSWSGKTQIDLAHSNYGNASFGYMVSEHATWQPFAWLQASAALSYFNTDDFASRLYTYEQGPLYSFSFPVFYGEGIHCSLFARADVGKHLMFILKCGTTHYFDRDHISSGLQQIDASSMTDLELQMRWKF